MSKNIKNITTSISLPTDVFSDLQKISRERGASVSALVTELVKKEITKRNKLLAQQYQEAELDPDRQEIIEDLRKLDMEDWPDE